jgi:hypothetical protein
MLKTVLSFLGILIFNETSAQLQADFHCVGSAFDATNCFGFTDISVPGSSPIVRWHWDFGNGDTSNLQNIHPPQPINGGQPCYDLIGSYTVCLTVFDSNGNSNQKCKQNYILHDSTGVHCNWYVGISDLTFSDFQVYPNPVKNNLVVSTNNFLEIEIVVYDVMARKIIQKEFKNALILDTSQLSSGIYLFQLLSKNHFIFNGKFIKE